MTKDVLIAIKGMQFEGATDPEEIEVIQRGQYYERNGSHYLLYDEPVEGSSDIIKNRIKCFINIILKKFYISKNIFRFFY